MKFTFDRDAMIKEISIAQEIITNKSPVSILSNILIIAENNSLTIKATDSTVKFTTVIPVDIQEEGRTTIFCDKFMSILSSLPSGMLLLPPSLPCGIQPLPFVLPGVPSARLSVLHSFDACLLSGRDT